jgi:hypothetical protein
MTKRTGGCRSFSIVMESLFASFSMEDMSTTHPDNLMISLKNFLIKMGHLQQPKTNIRWQYGCFILIFTIGIIISYSFSIWSLYGKKVNEQGFYKAIKG